MEVNRCKKCGCFYNGKEEYCSSCNIKLSKVFNQMERYIEDEGIDLKEYKDKDELLGRISFGLGEFNKRDLLFGLENEKISNNLDFDIK